MRSGYPEAGPRIDWGSTKSILATVVLTLAFLALAAQVATGIYYFLTNTGPAISLPELYLNIPVMFLLFAGAPWLYLYLTRPSVPVAAQMGLTSRNAGLSVVLGIGVSLAIVLFLMVITLALVWSGILQEDVSTTAIQLQRHVKAHPELIVLLSLSAGITEEILFRGFLQPRIGILGASVLFGVVHASYGTVAQVVVPAIIAVVLGFLYTRTKSLWAPIVAHTMYDLVGLTVLFFSEDLSKAGSVPAIAFF